MATKPTIAGLEIEFDASLLGGTYSDGDTITTGNDESGNANHATGVNTPVYEATGWAPNAGGAARLLRADSDHFTFSGSSFIGTEMTWFAVAEVGDDGIIILSGYNTQTMRMLSLYVTPDGAVVAGFYDLAPGGPDNVTSADGLANEGDFVVLSFRHDNTTGKILRLNGVEVAASHTGTDDLLGWNSPYINRNNAEFWGDSRIAWISGYTTSASDAQIVDMEAYLNERFALLPTLPPAIRWFM